MLTILLIIIPGLYLLFLLTRKIKWTFDERRSKMLRIFHFGVLALLILLGFLAKNNFFLRGYWTTKIIIWVFVITAITLFAFGYRPLQRKIERFYYGFFFYAPLTLIPLSFIPFFGIAVLLTIYGFMIGDSSDIKYTDSKYRLQDTYRGFLAHASLPDLFIKSGLLEHKENQLPANYFGGYDSIKINELELNKIEIDFYHNGQFTDEESPIKVIVEVDY